MNEFAGRLLVIGMRKGERECATKQQFNVRRRDLLVNADAICQLASKLRALDGLPLLPKEDQAEAFSMTVCEVEYLTAIIGTRHAQIVCHPVMRSRIEYLLCCLHALLPYEREAGQLNKLLLGMFRLFKVVLSQGKSSSAAWSEEDDILSVSNTVRTWSASVSAKDVDSQTDISSAIPGRSSWLDICLASISSFIVEVLRRDPRLLASLPVSTSEAVALASSPRWQVQYLGMGICCASTSAELQDMQQRLAAGCSKRAPAPSSHKLVASGSEKTIKAPATVSSRRRSMGGAGPLTRSSSSAPSSSSLTNKATPETVLTLSRNGGLRAILWCLLHKHWAVRVLALQFLRNLLDIAECLRSDQQGIVEEIWAACAEQGLVVLLETVAQGLSVLGSDHSGQPMRFPEMEVRQCATLLLDAMAAGLAGLHGGLARHRLVSALSYSAGDGLRKNSLLSVLYLCGRSPALSQHLFSPHSGLSRSMVASSVQPACIVLQEIFKQDAASVVSLLQMLMLFVNGAESWFQVAQRASVNEVATQAGHRRMSPKDTLLLWPNFVRIRRRDGREVRMTCPPLSLIAAQCSSLAGRMEVMFAILCALRVTDHFADIATTAARVYR